MLPRKPGKYKLGLLEPSNAWWTNILERPNLEILGLGKARKPESLEKTWKSTNTASLENLENLENLQGGRRLSNLEYSHLQHPAVSSGPPLAPYSIEE